jgi:hypothetical protein
MYLKLSNGKKLKAEAQGSKVNDGASLLPSGKSKV